VDPKRGVNGKSRVRAVAVLALAVASTGAPSVQTVPCGEAIDTVRFPYAGYRTVLGEVGVPGPYLTQVVATRERPWTHWRKAGLLVRAGSPPVTVSVARAWRDRAAITWGNDTGIVTSLRIAGCPGSRSVGHAYAGGFYLRARSACVPLTFRVGRRSATVRFGVGRRCVS
jgi:hypothetical protein